MADSTLWPVVVGGLLTMGGGIITGGITLVVNAIQASHETKKRRNEKFEELVTSVYEFDTWLSDKEAIVAFGQEGKVAVSPFAKIEAISAVYFPMFLDQIKVVHDKSVLYQLWMTNAGYKRMTDQVAQMNDGLNDVYQPYMNPRDELLESLKKYAVEHFK